MMASSSGQYMSIIIKFMEDKYGWTTDGQKNLNEALMNVLPALGTICGSGMGSILMSRGRARAFIVACCVGIFGSLFTFIQNFYVFLFAKFIVGASIGLTGVVVARYIEEYVPLKWFGTAQAISLASLQGGIFLSTIIGAVLPPDESEDLGETNAWIFIFMLHPILMVITIALFLILIRTDTPRFYLSTGQEEKAKLVLKKMYDTKDNKVKLDNIVRAEKAAMDDGGAGTEGGQAQGTKISPKEALWSNDKYVRSSWTSILIMAFQCLTGYYAIIAYSEVLLDEDFSEGRKINTRQGVFLIQGFNLIGAICSIYLISKVGRRTIILVGQGGIAFSLVGIAIASLFNSPVTLLVLICIVAFLFQLTLGPLAPMYAAEVCCDIALGFVMITEDVVVLLQEFVTPVLLTSPMQPVGVFFMYGVFSMLGLIYIYLRVPETMGLSEQEKREIFWPGSKYGRKLKPGEECDAGIEHQSETTIKEQLYASALFMLSKVGSASNSGDLHSGHGSGLLGNASDNLDVKLAGQRRT